MAQLTANFEKGTNGNAVATTDPGSADAWNTKSGTGCTYDNTHAYDTLSMKTVASGGGQTFMQWDTSLGGTITNHFGRIYLYQTVNAAAQFRIVTFLSTGTQGCQIRTTGLGKVQAVDSASGQACVTTNSLTLNQWVRIEWHITHSATVGQVELKLFNNPDSSTATETIQSTASFNLLASANQAAFGAGSGGSDGTYWLDNIVANAASYPGPATAASASNYRVIHRRRI